MRRTPRKPLYGIIAVGGGLCTLVYDCRGLLDSGPAAASLQGDMDVLAECDPGVEFPVVDLSGFEGALPQVKYVAEEFRHRFDASFYQPLAGDLAILRQAGVPIRRCRNGVLRPEPREPEPDAPRMTPRRPHTIPP